ncbi:type II secretion system protein N [Tahibacter soli]|uniref:Type II secretion system protein N n=1 Tax=Tahibacter soli TaxID=2983605 RepID=A0A9X3YQH6_9GAMM|nr:type II secretion system protein N [Tahibacter soli]MDC8015640.1 type II secretion system protein N [Tahibacter soli]
MRAIRLLVMLLFVLVVIVAVVALTLPADLALRWFRPNLGPLQLSGVAGTVWEGRAGTVSAFGKPLGALEWHVEKTPIVFGRVVANASLGGASISASGDATRDSDGSVLVRNAKFSFPAELAAPALDIPALKLLGTVDGSLSEGRIVGGWIAGARGSARWREAGVVGEAEARFGDVLAEFASAPDGSIAGTVKDDGTSSLVVDGQFVVRSGEFDSTVKLGVRAEDNQLREALRYIGEPQADGTSLLKIHGQLLKLF